jgi:hypothetical protein
MIAVEGSLWLWVNKLIVLKYSIVMEKLSSSRLLIILTKLFSEIDPLLI